MENKFNNVVATRLDKLEPESKEKLNEFIAPVLGAAARGIGAGLGAAARGVGAAARTVGTGLGAAARTVGTGLKNAATGVQNTVSNIGQGVKTAVSSPGQALQSAVNSPGSGQKPPTTTTTADGTNQTQATTEVMPPQATAGDPRIATNALVQNPALNAEITDALTTGNEKALQGIQGKYKLPQQQFDMLVQTVMGGLQGQ